MRIFELQYKLKSGADIEELLSLFNEIAVPIYRKIPGLISATIHKYSSAAGNPVEWDYVFVEVWESEEAHRAAVGKYIGINTGSELERTGYYDKVMPSIEKYSMAIATPIASSK